MILILGVTASGKGGVGFELSRRLAGEIVSIDSMKVYRRMNIGTAKPSVERQKQVKYHIIDVAEPSESFSVDRFLELAGSAIEQIKGAQKRVIAVGGTAMYIKALLYGLFEGPGSVPEIRQRLKAEIAAAGAGELHRRLSEIDSVAAGRIHPNDARRIIRALEVFEVTGKPISSFQQQFGSDKPLDNWRIIGLCRRKEIESRRINSRVKWMIDGGLVDEVKSLLAEEKPLSSQAGCAIGYSEIIDYVEGKMELGEAVEKIKINTRRLAKGQRTWFKTFKEVNWLDIGEDEPADSIVERVTELVDE